MVGKTQMSQPSSRRLRKRIVGTTSQSASHQPQENCAASPPGSHFLSCEGEHELKQSAWIYQNKIYLMNLFVLFNNLAGSVGNGRTVNAVYLGFSKAFDIIFHSNFVDRRQRNCTGRLQSAWIARFIAQWSATQSPTESRLLLAIIKGGYQVVHKDFSKAFGHVSHSILLGKLASHGLDRCTVHLVMNWLDGLDQRIIVNEVQSRWLVSSGISQSSTFMLVLTFLSVVWLRKSSSP